MKIIKTLGLICGTIALFASLPVALAEDHWSDDWEILIAGKADNAGSLSFLLTFEPASDGTVRDPLEVTAPIPANTGENEVAEMLGNAFRAVLGEEDFDIDVAWGENIEIEAEGDTPDFVLSLENNPLQGISIEIND